MFGVLGACLVSLLLWSSRAENDGALSTHLAPTDWSEVFVCTVDGSVHSLNALTGDVLWSYETEALGHREQLSFMAQGQNFTFYPDRRKGDIYTSRDGKTYAPFPAAKKLVEMSPFQWDEGKAIFLAKKSHKRYFVDPESGDDISPSTLQCEIGPDGSPANGGGGSGGGGGGGGPPLGLSRWIEIIRTDYDIVAEQILDAENPFPLTNPGSPSPRGLEVLKFSVSDYKLFLRTAQSAHEDEVGGAMLPRLTDIGGDEGGTMQAHHPSSHHFMWQRKFAFPLTHSAHVLLKAGNYEYLTNVKVEDAAYFEYLAIGSGEEPVFDEGGRNVVPVLGERGRDSLPFSEVKLLPAPPPAFSEVQIAVIAGAIFGGIAVLCLILFYIKCVRVRSPPPPSLPLAPSLPASSPSSPLPSASASPEIPAIPALPPPLTPNLTSVVVSSRYAREFEELGGLEGEEGKTLGKGGYGTVVRVRNLTDDNFYAVKKVRKFSALSLDDKEQILREVKLFAKFDHQNIVRYFASWVEEEEVPRGTETEEEDRSVTRTLTQTPPRAKRKVNITPTTILETAAGVTPFSLSRPTSLQEVDEDMLGFEFASDEKDDVNCLTQTSSGNSLSSLSSQASQQSQLSELSQLSRNASAESLNPISDTDNKTTNLSASSSLCPLLIAPSQGCNQIQWTLFIQMQLCSGGTLEHWMARTGRKVEPELNLHIFSQIVSALRYVHDPPHGLIHRDLKPANIFMVDDRTARVGDFGLSKRTHRMEAGGGSAEESLSHTAGVGSPLYCSPEQLAGREYTNKTDIFSLGVIFVEMHHVFSTKMERNLCLQDYRHNRFPKDPNHMFGPTSALGQFVRQLLHHDPSQRPTARQVLEHDIFKMSSSLAL